MGVFGKKDSGIFEVLKNEHREVSSLMEQIEGIDIEDIDDAKDLFAVLQEKLLAHASAEEDAVYPRFGQYESLHELILEARQEHELVEQLLVKLD